MIKGVNIIMLHKIYIAVLILISAVVLFEGCGNQVQETKSMEQIQTEQGVPVRVEEIKYQPFQKNLSFFTQLEGIKEATKGSMVGGRIDRIRAKVGDRVVKDQVVIEFAEDNPGLQYEQAKTGLENAEKTYNRMKALLAAGETSQAAFDGAEANYLVSKRNFESLRQMLHLQAPFDGTIVEIKVNEGDNVKSDIPLFKVAQINRMRAKVWANEDEISMIKKGMKAYTEIGGRRFNGVVSDISMAIDPMRRAFYAVVEFDNPGLVLKSGMTADVKVLVYDNPKAIVIPRNVVMRDNKGMYVFVEDNDTAVKKYISNGRDEGISYEVSGGLSTGDKLITQGSAQVNNGTKVKVIN
jgi:membrane fusion protein, multidrug efflux system